MRTILTVACIFLGVAICALAENSLVDNVEFNENEVNNME